VASRHDLAEALALAPLCVAADGGARLALDAGVDLAAVIGDFDSVGADLGRIPVARRFEIAEQDSTDFDKALRHIAAPVVLAVGFTGGRLDHQLAALHVLVAYPERPCVLIGETEVSFVCPPQVTLPLVAGDVVSLFPMAPVAGTSRGLRWEIDGLDFDPVARIGTSNAAMGPVALTMTAPAMLVVVPRARLAAITQALASAPPAARWTARAARYTAPPQS
jgi:thiamine pyrophosphokinase